jgi:hypothetical protein
MGGSPKFCRACGRGIRPDAQFCTGCGQVVQADGQAIAGLVQESDAAAGSPPTTGAAAPSPPGPGPSAPRPVPAPPRPAPWPGTEPLRPPEDATPPVPPRESGSSRPWLIAGVAVVVLAGAAAAVLLIWHPFRAHDTALRHGTRTHAATHAPSPTGGPGSVAATSAVPATTGPANTGPATAGPTGAASTGPASSPGTSASASPQVQQAAVGLAALLARSGGDRSSVNSAYNDALGCGPNLSQDAAAFRAAAASRRRLLTQLAALPGRSALPAQLLTSLADAWQVSIMADDDFAAWARDEAAGVCTVNGGSDPHFQAAYGPDIQATRDKRAVTRLWDPLAARFGLPAYQPGDL